MASGPFTRPISRAMTSTATTTTTQMMGMGTAIRATTPEMVQTMALVVVSAMAQMMVQEKAQGADRKLRQHPASPSIPLLLLSSR